VDGGQDFRSLPRKRLGKIPATVSLGSDSHGQACRPVPVVGDSDRSYQGEPRGGSVVLGSLLPGVPMVQTAQARHGNQD
jgi:hypothetical protein